MGVEPPIFWGKTLIFGNPIICNEHMFFSWKKTHPEDSPPLLANPRLGPRGGRRPKFPVSSAEVQKARGVRVTVGVGHVGFTWDPLRGGWLVPWVSIIIFSDNDWDVQSFPKCMVFRFHETNSQFRWARIPRAGQIIRTKSCVMITGIEVNHHSSISLDYLSIIVHP